MLWISIPILLLIFFLLEALLRIHYIFKTPFLFMERDGVFYRYKPNQHKYQLDNLRNLGKPNIPKITIYDEGIRSPITKKSPFYFKDSIICLGCSITEGGGLIEEDTYPGKLQKLMPDHDVVNAGISGYGLPHELEMLKRLIKYKPKIVVLQLFGFARTKYAKPKKDSIIPKIYFTALYFYPILSLFKKEKTLEEKRKMNEKNQKELWKINQPYLNDIRDICKKNKIKLIMFVWPSWFWNADYFHEQTKKYCEKNHIDTFDLRNMFSFYNKDEITIKNDSHPNPKCNHLVAKVTCNCIKGIK